MSDDLEVYIPRSGGWWPISGTVERMEKPMPDDIVSDAELKVIEDRHTIRGGQFDGLCGTDTARLIATIRHLRRERDAMADFIENACECHCEREGSDVSFECPRCQLLSGA